MGQYLGSSGDVISHLNISSLHSSDGGLYKCSAANTVGRASHQANINIYGQSPQSRCYNSDRILMEFVTEKTKQVF